MKSVEKINVAFTIYTIKVGKNSYQKKKGIIPPKNNGTQIKLVFGKIIVHNIFGKIMVESDYATAVIMVKGCVLGMTSATIVRRIQGVSKQLAEFKIQHVRRVNNLVVDYLAKTCKVDMVDVRIIGLN